jgi:hypothetical protein
MVLDPSYDYVLNYYHRNGYLLREPSRECAVASEGLSSEISVLRGEGHYIEVNASLLFQSGSAICGSQYMSLPSSDTSWQRVNGSSLTIFRTLQVTKELRINLLNQETTLGANGPVGQWPIIVNGSAFESQFFMLPFSLSDMAGESVPGGNFSGAASLLTFNNSIRGTSDYNIGSGYFPVNSQIYSDREVIPQEKIFLPGSARISSDLMLVLKAKLLACNITPDCVLNSFAFSPSVIFRNNSLFEDDSPLLSRVASPWQQWLFLKNASLSKSELPFDNESVSFITCHMGSYTKTGRI